MSDFLKNKCINIKWRLKAFQNICGRSFCQYATNTIFSSTIGEESSMIKWMYLAIIYIKYSIYLMKLWDLMFIRPLFFCFFFTCLLIKLFWRKKRHSSCHYWASRSVWQKCFIEKKYIDILLVYLTHQLG